MDRAKTFLSGKTVWPELWRPILVGLAILQGHLLLGIERDRLVEARMIRQLLPGRDHSEVYDQTLDPRMQQQLPRLHVVDVVGKKMLMPPRSYSRQAVLVFVGRCAPCVLDVLKGWQRIAIPERPVYVITQSSAGEARRFRRMYNLALPFLLDPGHGPQLSSYNAVWRPRAYLLDAKARLRYIQARAEDSETAQKKVLELTAPRDAAVVEQARRRKQEP